MAIEFIRDGAQATPGRPWFCYLSFGANDAPHIGSREWTDKYRNRFEMGYDRYRDVALASMKRLGMVPEKTEPTLADQLPRGNGAAGANVVRAWRSLSDDQKELSGRLAEAYAGLCSYTDHQVGRLLSYLDGSGQLDKTIVVVCSANATAEDSPDGLARKNAFSADWTGDAGAISSNDDLPAAASYDHQYCAGKAAELASLWEATAGRDGALAPGEPGRRLRMVAAESGQPKVKLRPRPGAAAARR